MMKNLLFVVFIISKILLNAQVHERWQVKTLTDGFEPDTSIVEKVSVKYIHNLTRHKVGDNDSRYDFEKNVLSITGTITSIKMETGKHGDMDYHVEISDSSLNDSTFVCEILDPENSLTKNSAYIHQFQNVRKLADHLKIGDKVTFTGIQYQDQHHKPSKHRTRNFVEMHPVIKVVKF